MSARNTHFVSSTIRPTRWLLPAVLLLVSFASLPAHAQLTLARQEQKWLEAELESFQRLANWLGWDEYRARLEKDKWNRLRDEAIRFSNGATHSSFRAAYVALLRVLELTPAQTYLLQQPLPEMAADQFIRRPSLYIVRPNGALLTPPQPLLGESRLDPQCVAAETFGNLWKDVASDLKAGQPISVERLVKLRQTLDEWKDAASASMASVSPRRALAASAHLTTAGIMLDSLSDDASQQRLGQFLRVGDGRFPGGTVGDLVRHVLDNPMSVKFGTRPQLVLANLTHDMIREVDARVAVLENRIEHYKAQNPAHNAALKEILIAAGGHHGVPSLFTFPQGQQHGGLQSLAYAHPIPQRPGLATPALPTTSPHVVSPPAGAPVGPPANGGRAAP